MQPLMELCHGRQGKTKQGGSEMGKYPCVKRNDNACLPLLCGILPPTIRGTLAACGFIPYIEDDEK